MEIISTKKALPLFSKFPETTNQLDDQSFYSWHANYFLFNRKKILVLTNNLSFTPVVLADVNSKNKKQLDQYIKLGIKDVFQYSEVSINQVEKYFQKAGNIEISTNRNRSIQGINNYMIQLIQYSPEKINLETMVQSEIMKFLADVPYRYLNNVYSTSTQTVARELNRLK